MIKISVCVYAHNQRYVIAICHQTKASMVKAKLLSTDILDITPSNIRVIKDNMEIDASANEIILQCVSEAAESTSSAGLDIQSVSEIVYFGDVNLTSPGLNEYPTLLMDQEQFCNMIKLYFPACISIKRILVSSDQSIVVDAEKNFTQDIGKLNPRLPVIFDSFVNKSYKDLYTPIHLIDSALIDAILTYCQALQSRLPDDYPLYGFSRTQDCIERLQDNFEYLYGPEGFPLTFHFIEALKEDFMQLSTQHDSSIKKVFSIEESRLLPWAFSYLIPQSLRESILHRLNFDEYSYSVISVGDIKHHDLGDVLADLVKEEETHFQQYFETSDQLSEIISSLLERIKNFRANKSMIHQYAMGSKIKDVVDNVISDLELLANLLPSNVDKAHGLENIFSSLRQGVSAFSDEARRKRILSNVSFFSTEDAPREGFILETTSEKDVLAFGLSPSSANSLEK